MPKLAAAARHRSSLMKFRPLTVIVPTEKVMKEAIKIVLEFIYETESPQASRISIRNQIKHEWRGCGSFMKLKIGESFHTVDPHRLVPILKEEIDDPNLFRKVFSAFRNSAILSTVAGNIYLRKLDQEIGRIREKYEIPVSRRIGSRLVAAEEAEKCGDGGGEGRVALRTSGLWLKGIVWSPIGIKSRLGFKGDQQRPVVFSSSSSLVAFLNRPSSLLGAAQVGH
uniref:Maturase RT n=1 Tax=Pelargonium citronellum TaxID=73188 RepID=A0A1J0PJV7_9ROSI|nr:maturase RT [Pelargonium citronellum]